MSNFGAKIIGNAISGLQAQQAQIANLSNNIANVNTPGYSRRVVELESRASPSGGSGITIGDGAVIANNSHVVKNVEPYSIVGGNPAKLIKYRFSEDQIKKLLEIRWWDWSTEKINQFCSLLCNENIDQFIRLADKNSKYLL